MAENNKLQEREHYLKERMVLFSKRKEQEDKVKRELHEIHLFIQNLLIKFEQNLNQK